ncbi:MAG: hypothetical protein AAFS10_12170, partial [Myxococcota bacterium]
KHETKEAAKKRGRGKLSEETAGSVDEWRRGWAAAMEQVLMIAAAEGYEVAVESCRRSLGMPMPRCESQ